MPGVDELTTVAAFAPGRVNLIGDHTDYTGGLAMPMAIHLGTEVLFERAPGCDEVELTSSADGEPAQVPLALDRAGLAIGELTPKWARYVAGVVATVQPACGGRGRVTSDLPIGAGLSSSASLEVALALALGHEGTPLELARSCQEAESLATGVATGNLDQIAISFAREQHAMFLDCATSEIAHVELPPDVEIVAVHCGVDRTVASSAYGERQSECATAEREIGPLRSARPWEVDRISDRLVRRRARHVVSENARVRAYRAALEQMDLKAAGELMNDSHRSLSADYDVSIWELDELVGWMQSLGDVFGARLTGAGFGGCAVAMCRPGALTKRLGGRRHWVLKPAGAASLRPELAAEGQLS